MSAKLQLVVVEDSKTDAELLSRCLTKAGIEAVIYRVQTEAEFIAALHERGRLIRNKCAPQSARHLSKVVQG